MKPSCCAPAAGIERRTCIQAVLEEYLSKPPVWRKQLRRERLLLLGRIFCAWRRNFV